MITMGLDMSLTGTGIAIRKDNNIAVETIKTTPTTCKNELERFRYISDEVMKRIPENVNMICIEDFFTPLGAAQMGAAIKLVMLGTTMRLALYKKNLPFCIISPQSLKKHILGKGTGQKSFVVREVFRKYGLDVSDDNQADAAVLSVIAEHLFLTLNNQPVDMTKPQEEVIKKVIGTLKERSYNI